MFKDNIATIKASSILPIWFKKDCQERLSTNKAIVYQVAPFCRSKINSSKINTWLRNTIYGNLINDADIAAAWFL